MTLLQVKAIADEQTEQYDALVATLGFETRCTYIPEMLRNQTSRIWAFDYPSNGILAYNDNRRFFEQFNIFNEDDHAFRKSLRMLIDDVRDSLSHEPDRDETHVPRIAVDISSMDRDRIARTVLACTTDQSEPLIVDFYYTFGAYDPSLVGSEGAVLVNRPVDGLEGWPTSPDAPLICALGLGFESRLATAAIETLEPARTVALVPRGEDSRYDNVVAERNRDLLGGGIGDVHTYSVGDITRLTAELDASVTVWSRNNRVVIVPIGPKTLALAAILVGAAHPHNVTVWRMSADEGRAPEDRVPTGTIAAVSVSVVPSPNT